MAEIKDNTVSAPADVWVAWVRDNLETTYSLERVVLELEHVLGRYRRLLELVLDRMGDFDALVEVQRTLRDTTDIGLVQ